jgi:predicted Zn-dependent protease with MMP-like domain
MAKRSRGRRRRYGASGGPTSFEKLVWRALDAIPEPFSRALDEVAVVVEPEPTRQQRRDSGLGPQDSLYGLYEGVARTEYGADWAFVPNKISLFQVPLEEDFPDPDELEHQVWITVIHELAHHLGIDEGLLHELGVD